MCRFQLPKGLDVTRWAIPNLAALATLVRHPGGASVILAGLACVTLAVDPWQHAVVVNGVGGCLVDNADAHLSKIGLEHGNIYKYRCAAHATH